MPEKQDITVVLKIKQGKWPHDWRAVGDVIIEAEGKTVAALPFSEDSNEYAPAVFLIKAAHFVSETLKAES